jgi:hypothetical protein
MSDLLLDGERRKPVSSLPLILEPRRREARPPPCAICCGACWWNGWRVVFPVVATTTVGAVERRELPLPRAKCSCCHLGFTCYPPGFYPRRQYQLDVVAEVVAAVEIGCESTAVATTASSASPTSVRRWSVWIGALADVTALHAVAAQVDPSTAAVATPTPTSRTTAVLDALEVLGAALGPRRRRVRRAHRPWPRARLAASRARQRARSGCRTTKILPGDGARRSPAQPVACSCDGRRP